MNTIDVTYNINSDEVIRQVDDTMRRITEITRVNSSEQVRLMTEVYSSLTSILENYMSNVRNQFSTYIDIAKNTWQLASSDAKDYFDELSRKNEEVNNKFKVLTDEALQKQKDATKEKLDNVDKETSAKLESLKKQDEAERESMEARKKLREFTGGMNEGIGGIIEAGHLGSTTSSILKMGGNLVGGGLNIASGLNAGQGVKDIMGVMTEGIGMLIESVKETDNLKRQIISGKGMQGEDVNSIYGNELSYGKSNSLLNRLKITEEHYAGTPEFEDKAQLQLQQQYQQSRGFGEDTDYHKLGVDTTLIGKSRGIGGSEVASLFIEMQHKLHEPIENLTGRFFQLDNIAKDLGINIKEVIRGYQQLMTDNERYGYTQEQLMGFYSTFGDEIKKGTISVSQLSEFMRGVAGMGTDKSVGLASMLTQDQEGLMNNFSGNKQNGNQILSILNKAMSSGDELGAGQLLRMMNNPEADYSQDKNLSGLLKQYGLSQTDLKKLNPDVEKLIMAQSQSMAGQSGEGMGGSRVIYEKMMDMMGMPLSSNLFDSMQQQKGYGSVGTKSGVMGLDDAKTEGKGVIDNQDKLLYSLVSLADKLEGTLKLGIERTGAIGEETYKTTHDLSLTTKAMFESIKKEGDNLVSLFGGKEWSKEYDKFGNSVDNFANAVGGFTKTVDVIEKISEIINYVNPGSWIAKGLDFAGQHSKDWDLFGANDGMADGKFGAVLQGITKAHR